MPEARLYGEDPSDGTGGAGAFFLLLDEPEVYGLPPDPIVTTADLPRMWKHAALAAARPAHRGRRGLRRAPPMSTAGPAGSGPRGRRAGRRRGRAPRS